MNTPSTGALLAHDKADRYRSFGAFGKPAHQSHVQLRAMLKAKRSDRFANYFAKPTVDPDSGELRWTAELPGVARGWHEMDAEEQGQRALDLEVMRSGLLGFVQELRAQGGAQPGGAAAFASLLEQAMKVPSGGNFLYFVGDQPVIAFWGFEDASGHSIDPAAQAPRLAAPAMAVPPAVAPLAATAVATRRRPWWWWLLWLLLALLLLALLLLLPRACTPDGGLDLRRALPGAVAPDAAGSAPGARGATGPDGMPPVAADGSLPPGATPQAGLLPPGAASGADPALPSASQPGLALPPDTMASAPADMAQQPDAKPDPKTDPPKPEPGPDAKDGKDPKAPKDDPLAKPDKGQTNPPKPATDPKGMKLPDSPDAQKKLGFLEGDWKAGEGLFDKGTGQPLDMGFKFGKDGRGEVSVRRPDGTTCKGTVQGSMSGGKLGIAGNQSIPCSNGSTYGAPKIECQKERADQTHCYGVNPDGSRYEMDMHRK